LTTSWEILTVTETTVATEVHQSLEGSGNLPAEISLYLLTSLNDLSDLINLLFGEIVSSN
jgi:hypothetical protein